MITIFILIALAMTIPAISEGADEQELRAQKISEFRHEVEKKKVWAERQKAREEWLQYKDRADQEKEQTLQAHLEQIQSARNNRAPAAEVVNDRYQYRKEKYDRWIASAKDRRQFIREMRKQRAAKERFEASKINERIQSLAEENERD